MLVGQDSDDQYYMVGSFIDKEIFSIHWIHGKMREGVVKASQNAQSFETMCQYTIEYPILCY